MFLAEEATTTASTGTFALFDIFMLVITLIIAISVFRLVKAKPANKFALGFTTVALLVFLAVDGLVFLSWIGQIQPLQDYLFG